MESFGIEMQARARSVCQSTEVAQEASRSFDRLGQEQNSDEIQDHAQNTEFSLPQVDGGKDAWLFLAACFVVEALVWGKYIMFLGIQVRNRASVLSRCIIASSEHHSGSCIFFDVISFLVFNWIPIFHEHSWLKCRIFYPQCS
jgi:hypothetical protein